MKTMGLGVLAMLGLALGACVTEADGAADDAIAASNSDEASARQGDVDLTGRLRLGEAPVVTGNSSTAHSNCGHMLWCQQGSQAIYCYYNQATTGCTNTDVFNDAQGDCQAVCGHTLCLNLTVRPC